MSPSLLKVSVCLLALAVSVRAQGPQLTTFTYDFRKGLPEQLFEFVDQTVQQVDTGIEMKVEVFGSEKVAVTVKPRFKIVGDFEMEAGYESLSAAGSGYLEAALFGINLADPSQKAIRMRTGKLQQKARVSAYYQINKNGTHYPGTGVNQEILQGRLRIVRRDDIVEMAIKAKGEKEFTVVSTTDASTAESQNHGVELTAVCAGEGNVQVVWTDVRIAAETLLYVPPFDQTISLYVMNGDGTGLHQVSRPLPSMFAIGSPHWSPDGQTIAFDTWTNSQDYHVGIVKRDGSDLRLLCKGATPSFSEDGEYLLYSKDGIRRRDMLGTFEELIHPERGGSQWSPDGKYLAYQSGKNIYLVDVDTDQTRPLLSPEQADAMKNIDRHLSWSNDSQSIAFRCTENGVSGNSLFIVDVNDVNLFACLLEGENLGHDLAWSPDDQQILFSRYSPSHKRRNLGVVSRQEPNQIRDFPNQPQQFSYYDCEWSKDDQIAFTAKEMPQLVGWETVKDEFKELTREPRP